MMLEDIVQDYMLKENRYRSMVDREYLLKSISKLKINVLCEEFVWNKMELSTPFCFHI
ncbi:hypothetical protein IC582_003044 [Cucumis melo]